MPNISSVRKFSIGWFSSKYEEAAMRYINLFSLPSLDRLRYYPWLSNSLPFYYLPNFPSLKVYKQRNDLFLPEGKIRLIFQGSLGEGHALEEILELMQEKIEGRTLELVLKGPVRDAYKKKLSSLAEVYGVVSRVYWHGIGPYVDLPELTKTCHIGIAIYMGKDEVSKTLGTASNKIYEYAACGLPVLLFDNEQFRKNLANVDWAYFTDGKKESLKAEIVNILKGWADKSKSGRVDFEHTYNFEIHFTKLIKSISLAE